MKGAPVTEIDYIEVDLIDHHVKASWSYAEEGRNGFYDPEDPEDTPLLRFDVCRFVDGEWEYVEDSSYCAMVPCDTPRERLLELLRVILDDVADDVRAGISIKKKCEHLSWITA